MVFAKCGFESTIVHIGNSNVAERSWHVVHSARGPLLFGAWYRPPKHGEVATIDSLDEELAEFGKNVLGTILVGDFNVHEASWFRHSDGTSPEGRALRDVACSHGWEERVQKPTRGPYLLDLVLTDLGSDVKARPVAGVSDHFAVLGSLDVSVHSRAERTREVYDFAKVSWNDLAESFHGMDWDAALKGLDADRMAERLTDLIVEVLDNSIPKKILVENTTPPPMVERQVSLGHRQKDVYFWHGRGDRRKRRMLSRATRGTRQVRESNS